MFEKLRGFKVAMVAVALIALLTAVGGLVISGAAGGQSGIRALVYNDVVRFTVQNEKVEIMRAEVFDLGGKRLFDSGPTMGNALDWAMTTESGERVAHGVYLYVITAWDAQGQLLKSQVGKLALVPGGVGLGQAPALVSNDKKSSPVLEQSDEQVRAQAFDAPGNWTVGGLLGIGTDGPGHPVDVIKTVTGTGSAFGEALDINFDPPSNTTNGDIASLSVKARVPSGNSQDFLSLYGGFLNAIHRGNGTLSKAFGFQGRIQNFEDGIVDQARALFSSIQNHGPGTINAGYGLYVQRPRNLGVGIFNSFYGIFLENPTEAANNWSIFSQGGQNYFGGNVGIGVQQPSAALDISASTANLIRARNSVSGQTVFRVEKDGDVRADGAYYSGTGGFFTGSADVAERINTSEWVEEGDVVEIDPEHRGFFRKTRSPYSTNVAGVISTSPGVILGNNFEPKVDKWEDSRPMLALTGRVPVKVTAENGAIGVGDLLVSSSKPGYAMKCSERAACVGATIGKALDTLEEGTGLIMAQVTLR